MSKATRTRVIGTTRILETVGKGGMAEVYRGLQTSLQREVAVKVILPEVSKQADAASRFRREAMALAAMQHENIVAIHDLIEKNDQLFMVMEFIDGEDVHDLIGRAGRLPLDVALLIGAGVAAALEHAHFRKVLHRDIKPSNVVISRAGEVKLTDFGIAKDTTIDDLTKTGMVVGTPAYLAPELVTGAAKAEPRADLYALGVLLYEALSGKRPFSGIDQVGELFAAIATGRRPKLRAIAPDVPRPVARVVEKLMAVKMDRRYASAADAHQDLSELAADYLSGPPAARLVRFMHQCGYIRDDELSAILDPGDFSLDIELGDFEMPEEDEEDGIETGDVPAATSQERSLAKEKLQLSHGTRKNRQRARRRRRGWLGGAALATFGTFALLTLGTALAFQFAPAETAAVIDQLATWLREGVESLPRG